MQGPPIRTVRWGNTRSGEQIRVSLIMGKSDPILQCMEFLAGLKSFLPMQGLALNA